MQAMVRVLAALAAAAVLLAPGPASGSGAGGASSCAITQDRSLGGSTPATIEFVNQTAATVSVHWLDYNATRQLWLRLPAGQRHFQGTYIGHAWVVTDLAGTCIGFVVATQREQRYVISGAAPAPTPAPAPASGSTYSDPPGDGGNGADITTVRISNDAGGRITMRIDFARLRFDDTFILCVDVDRNRATGLQDARLCPLGADYDVYAHYYGPWEISAITYHPGPTTATSRLLSQSIVSISGDASSATLSVDRNQLGGTSGLDFQIWTEPVPGDRAPDSGTWTYTLQSPAPAPTPTPAPAPKPSAPATVAIAALKVQARPAAPVAGSTFSVLVPSLVLSTGQSVAPTTFSCRARVGTAALKGGGQGGCTFRIPKTAGGKRLSITVTAGYRGKTKTRAVAYTIRRPAPPPGTTTKPKPPTAPTTPGTTKSKCSATGVRYSGSTSEKKPLCFTIARNGKLLVEAKIGYGDVSCTGDDLTLRSTSLSTVALTGAGTLSGHFSVPFSQSVIGQIFGGGQLSVGTMTVSGTFKGVIQPSGTATGTLDWTLASSLGGVTCKNKVPPTWTATAER